MSTVSSTFPADLPEVRLVNELGVDAILSVTLDCSMAWEDGALSPRLSFKMSGGTNGWKMGPLLYGQGYVQGPGQGISDTYDENKLAYQQLEEIMNIDKVMEYLEMAMEELRKEEADRGYEKIWALK